MKLRIIALAVPFVLAVACDKQPASPDTSAPIATAVRQQQIQGSGLILNSVTGVSLPLIGKLGDVTINQAEITNFAIVEDVVGQIVGVQADGVLQLTGGVLGTNIVSEDFTTTLAVTSSGPGQCGIVTLDLAPINVNALVAQVDIPAATVDAKGS